ncbi:MAG: S8 family serine peptidase [Pseudomonadota bacterium]
MERRYTVGGREITLEIDETTLAVRFAEDAPRSVRATAADEPETRPFETRFEVPKEDFTVIQLDPATGARSSGRRASAASRLRDKDAVERVAEVYRLGSKRAFAPGRIAMGLSDGASLKDLMSAFGFSRIESFGDNEHLVSLPPGYDPIDVVNRLGEDKRVRYAEPDLVIFGKHIARRPLDLEPLHMPLALRRARPDPYRDEQYALFITEADLAHQVVRGSPDVRVAILDEGVDVGHPDLSGVIAGMYDATDDDAWQQPEPWDGHGTACAGLAAAMHDNGQGILGIGAGCSILAVRIAFSTEPGGAWVTRDQWIRRAIDWSVAQGADVISNSWGGGIYSQSIANAIERARQRGRGGKGAVVAVAAGNDGRAVDFPGYLDGVLTVSASNQFDEFKTRGSADGEYWWGSNHGPEVDVAAPGVGNLTTDIRGKGGYHPSGYALFNGTSSSTPIVAGACALLITVDPELGEAEIRETIRRTADKAGQFPYANGRNDQMGHGRLNVNKAVHAVLRRLPTS